MAESKRVRIVLDVNWLISASINANSRKKFEKLLLDEQFVFLACHQLFDEYDDVISRPAFRDKIKQSDIDDFKNIFVERVEIIKLGKIKKLVRDVKDDYLVAIAKKGKAQFIITGDDDLLVLSKIDGTKILTMSEFLKLFFR